jgi:hypothetical protein
MLTTNRIGSYRRPSRAARLVPACRSARSSAALSNDYRRYCRKTGWSGSLSGNRSIPPRCAENSANVYEPATGDFGTGSLNVPWASLA